jgi:hypothetical protein
MMPESDFLGLLVDGTEKRVNVCPPIDFERLLRRGNPELVEPGIGIVAPDKILGSCSLYAIRDIAERAPRLRILRQAAAVVNLREIQRR